MKAKNSSSDKAAKAAKASATKEISLTLAVEVADDVAPEAVAAELEKSLSKLDAKIGRISDVVVRTVPRFIGQTAGGYESRIWEKATCKNVHRPGDKLGDPVLELDKLADQFQRLESELSSLRGKLQALKGR